MKPLLIVFALLSVAYADSTFVPIEPPKSTVCQKVCPVCGKCIPIHARGARLYFCRTGFDSLGFSVPHCDSIIWGQWRKICRVDTVKGYTFIQPDTVRCFGPTIFDTIYEGDPRCGGTDSLKPSRHSFHSCDSVYTLPHDSVVVRDRPYPISDKYDTIKVLGHWQYIKKVNGRWTYIERCE
jgi:hypothetical protein